MGGRTGHRSGDPARALPIATTATNTCSIVVGVGLTWKPRAGGTYIFDGRDAGGRFYAHVSNLSGDWTAYIAPWGCGLERGLALGPFDDAREAMAAADRHVAAHAEIPPQ